MFCVHKKQEIRTRNPMLVQRLLSNRHIDLSDFSYAALSSGAVAGYGVFIRIKSPTNCDAYLVESL